MSVIIQLMGWLVLNCFDVSAETIWNITPVESGNATMHRYLRGRGRGVAIAWSRTSCFAFQPFWIEKSLTSTAFV